MKKIIIFILLIFMLLILTGCSNEYKSDKKFSHFDVVIIGGKLFYIPVYKEVEDNE